jgi:putative PIN family toxin of toxin-antitoxin system
MKIVLDTNVLLISISKKSPYRPIFDAIVNGKIKLVVSNSIISEYTEILEQKTNSLVAVNITEFLLKSKHVEKIEVFYKWELINTDKDDNKFIDCGIAGGASFIVTNDKHFNIIKDIPFPKIDIISARGFLDKLKE